jgi:putative DNA primase/helicase
MNSNLSAPDINVNNNCSSTTITFSSLVQNNIWVAWREEITKQGKPIKVPKTPFTGYSAKVPTDPSTYGTLTEAIQCHKSMAGTGGFGIVLGPIDDNRNLIGIDLDSCRDPEKETIADWAKEVIDRFDTCAEISPSQTGIKLFFQMTTADLTRLHALLGRDAKGKQLNRRAFAAGEHREVAIDTARFYAVTGHQLQDSPEQLRTVKFSDVEWFIKVAGPNYLAQQKASNGSSNGSGHHQRDESGSGRGFQFLQDCHRQGMSQQAAMTALLKDQGQAG